MVRFANDVSGGFAHDNLHIRASNPRPKGAGNAMRVRVQKSEFLFQGWNSFSLILITGF